MSLVVANRVQGDASGGALTSGSLDTTGAGCLIAFFKHEGAPVNLTFTDSKGNTWSELTKVDNSNGDLSGQMAYVSATPTVGTSHTFTCTPASNVPWRELYVGAFTEAYVALDVESNAQAASGTPDGGSLVITAAAVLVAATGVYGAIDMLPGTGWTEPAAWTAVGTGGAMYRIETGSGTFDPLFGTNPGAAWVCCSAAIKAAAAATGQPTSKRFGGIPGMAFNQGVW